MRPAVQHRASVNRTLARHFVDLVTDAAQHLGGAIDNGLDQPIQHALRLCRAAARLAHPVEEDGEGAGLIIPHRDQRLLGEDEGDIGQLRHIGFGMADHPRGHVARLSFGVDQLGGFEVAHFLARGDGDAKQLLDLRILLGRGVDHVDPDRIRERIAFRDADEPVIFR